MQYKEIALNIVRAYKYTHRKVIDDAENLAHDIAADLVIKNRDYPIRNIPASVRFMMISKLHNKARVRREQTILYFYDFGNLDICQDTTQKTEGGKISDAMQTLLDCERGPLMLIYLWRFRRRGIKDLIPRLVFFSSERWVMDNLGALIRLKKELCGRK